jgi:hypothetical protein
MALPLQHANRNQLVNGIVLGQQNLHRLFAHSFNIVFCSGNMAGRSQYRREMERAPSPIRAIFHQTLSPINFTRRDEIVSPNPVPPKRRVVEFRRFDVAQACETD